jgi:hypothetical protein
MLSPCLTRLDVHPSPLRPKCPDRGSLGERISPSRCRCLLRWLRGAGADGLRSRLGSPRGGGLHQVRWMRSRSGSFGWLRRFCWPRGFYWLCRGLAGRRRDRRFVRLLAADGVSEVAQTPAERPSHLRQPLRAEDEQRHYQDKKKVRRLQDVSDHEPKSLAAPDRA